MPSAIAALPHVLPTPRCRGNRLAHAGPAAQEVSELIVAAAIPPRRSIALQSKHRSTSALDAAVILLKSVVQIATCPMPHMAAEFCPDCTGIGIVAVRGDPIRGYPGHRLCRSTRHTFGCVVTHLEGDGEFADSPLEEEGFEPSVPSERGSGRAAPVQLRWSPEHCPGAFGGRGTTRRTRWDHQFESPLLQRGVHCELDHLLGAANRRRRHERTSFSLEAVLILWRAAKGIRKSSG
jgi:hypothetical protein